MMRIQASKLLPLQTVFFALALAISLTFSSRVSLAFTMSPQATAPSTAAVQFAGTWHWMLNGKSVVTMVVTSAPTGLTGSITSIQGIQLSQDGTVLKIEPGDGTLPFSNAYIASSVLHFETQDDDDKTRWTVTLKDDGTAEVRGAGENGPAMKPIGAEKVR